MVGSQKMDCDNYKIQTQEIGGWKMISIYQFTKKMFNQWLSNIRLIGQGVSQQKQ